MAGSSPPPPSLYKPGTITTINRSYYSLTPVIVLTPLLPDNHPESLPNNPHRESDASLLPMYETLMHRLKIYDVIAE